MDVSIIIVNYKTPQLLFQCIKSIYSHTVGCSFEVIVVDNNSEDESKSIIESNFPQVIYIYLNSNLGFGYANNRGSEIAKGQYLLFLNSDTIIIDDSISFLYKYIETNSDVVGVCGGNLYDENMKAQSSYKILFPSIIDELSLVFGNIFLRLWYGKSIYHNYTNKPIKVARVSGADTMMSRKLFNLIGGFDENFFMYSEETDLMFRTKELGYETICIPNAKIIHLEGRSCDFVERKIKWGLISRAKFFNKHYSRNYFVFCNFLEYITCTLFVIRGFLFKNRAMIKTWNYRKRNLFKIDSETPYF